MNEMDRWIYLDGPEPAELRPLFEALREGEPIENEADPERMKRGLLARLEAMQQGASLAESAAAAREAEAPAGEAPAEEPVRWAAQRVEEAEATGASMAAATEGAVVATSAAEEAGVATGASRLAGTGMAVELAREEWEKRGRLPFRAPSPNAPKAARTMQVPVMRTTEGETLPLGDESIARALALVPFLGNTVGTGTVPFPRLPRAHYARFCVELRLWPGRSAEIFMRYRVMHQAARAALDAYWGERFAAEAGERAGFEEEAAAYVATLRALWGAG